LEAVQAGNGASLSSSDRDSLPAGTEQIKSEIDRIGHTTSCNGGAQPDRFVESTAELITAGDDRLFAAINNQGHIDNLITHEVLAKPFNVQ